MTLYKWFAKRRIFDGRNSYVYWMTGVSSFNLIYQNKPWKLRTAKNEHPQNGEWWQYYIGPFILTWTRPTFKSREFDIEGKLCTK